MRSILFDDVDTVSGPRAKDNEDARGTLNAGQREGATALRSVVGGGNIGVEALPSFVSAVSGDDTPDTI